MLTGLTFLAIRVYVAISLLLRTPCSPHPLLLASYSMAVGDVDAAFAAVHSLPPTGSTAVWSNMAHACVATRRMDVAVMCLR